MSPLFRNRQLHGMAQGPALVKWMGCQPVGQHEAEKRNETTQPGGAGDLPARPADQTQAALAATTPFRNSGHIPLLCEEATRRSGVGSSGYCKVEWQCWLEMEAEFRCQCLGGEIVRARERREEVRSEEHTSELQSLRHLVCR